VSFTCSVCGEDHVEDLRDIRLGLPDAIYELAADAREARAWLSDDFAVLDDARFFVRGLLELPIPPAGDRFGYGLWLEVQLPVFQELMTHWHEPEQFAPVDGRVANELSPYEETTGLAVTLRAVAADKLPLAELHDAAHPLVRAQRDGIPPARAEELAAVAVHSM
jgi:hypothetical protein